MRARDIVVTHRKVTVIIDHPVIRPVYFFLYSDNGFSRKQLVTDISRLYHQLYNEEDATSGEKTNDEGKGLYNRKQSHGKYQIWGHVLADLILTGVDVYESNGGIYLQLRIDSNRYGYRKSAADANSEVGVLTVQSLSQSTQTP